MSTHRVSITEAKASLSSLVNRVAYRGERIVLESHGRPKAALVSLEDLEAIESGAAGTPLHAARAEGLRRIRVLSELIRRTAGEAPSGSVLDELTALREGRDADLDHLR